MSDLLFLYLQASKGSPGNAKSTLSKGPSTRSAEDIPRKVQLSFPGSGSPGPPSPQRRAVSPGTPQRRSLLPSPGIVLSWFMVLYCIILQ